MTDIIGRIAGMAREPQFPDDALCREVGGDMWFPEKGEHTVAREAKKICLRCEVKDKCLEYAFANHERYGVWGGQSERERARALRARRRAA